MNYKRLFLPNSYIFITIVTSKRRHILIDNVELLKDAFRRTKKFHNFEIFGIVILPDHMHLLLKPEIVENYPKIVHLVKTFFSKTIDISSIKDYKLSDSRKSKQEKDIWQRRYWEHTITDEEDLYNHLDYIHYNPVKHNYVKAVRDWQYSSFEKFVKKGNYELNWGNYNNIKSINSIDYD